VIHLATHVFTPPGEAGRAFIAFALNPAAEPEFLTTTDIAMLHVPGAVVAMTGCQSAAGDPRPGVGLQGLTRAWSIAGARAVVATLWHVQDSGGRLFASFYQHLHDSTAAEALRLGQVAMIHSGTPLSAPSAWASYQVFQGGQ
jgi:CHAT domain-containing protein